MNTDDPNTPLRSLTGYLPLDKCIKGHVYKLRSRNLAYGVFDGKDGFIGIREKFGERYLFTEYHWDYGGHFGTVKPLEEMIPLPPEIPAIELLSTGEKDEFGEEKYIYNRKLLTFLETLEEKK